MDKPELRHYASKYYDPVKAHEYYMRNRELKGRRSTSKLSDEGKKVWQYTKQQITEEKKSKVEAEKEAKDQKTEELREKASATRERITAKLKELNEKLSKKDNADKESIEKKRESDLENIRKKAVEDVDKLEKNLTSAIEKLMAEEIPKSLSKEERAKRIAERNEKIAKLRSDASAEKNKLGEQLVKDEESAKTDAASSKEKVSADTKNQKEANSKSAAAERKQCAADLKSSIAAAREAYKVAKENLDSDYEEIFQQEFDKIASQYAKPTKQSKKKSSSSGLDKYRIKK